MTLVARLLRIAIGVCVPVGLLLVARVPAEAQEGVSGHDRALEAPLVDASPTVDGRFDEPLWSEAAIARDFVQNEPVEGAPATMATEVLVAYTRDALLIGARMRDPDPAAVVAREYREDANLESDDSFIVILDTYHDHRSAYYFRTNAVGAREDGLIQNEGQDQNREWDGVWSVGSRRTSTGWNAEIRIPFQTLRFPEGAGEFGVNFGRQIARTREQGFWAAIDNDWGFNAMWRISAYGVLTGLEAADPGGRFKLKPFAVAGVTGEEGASARVSDIGLDAKVALSSNLNLDVTFNTDFAQVEADEQQVNLTRFELFFPEQREFFLENAGLFQVGENTRPFEPPETLLFFSRRIGLSDDGDILPILGGARLTGKLGAFDVGAFHIRQQSLADGSPGVGFSAARLRRDVLERSSIGLLMLDQTERGGRSHRVGAADFSWTPTELVRVGGFAARSATPGAEGRETAWAMSTSAGTDRWNAQANFSDIGAGFESQMGFVPRTGIRKYKFGGLWSPRIGRFGIRQIFVGPDFLRITETDGSLQSERVNFGPYVLFNDGSSFFIEAGRAREGLSESFELRDGVRIEEGLYQGNEASAMLMTSESRRLSFQVFATAGAFFDGTLRVVSPGLAVRPHPRVRLSANYSRSQIRLPQPNGRFDTNLLILRGLVAISPDAFVRGLLQWNRDAENDGFSGNVQLRWTWRPGSDIYLVFNERRPLLPDADDPARREVLLKGTWYWTPG